VINHTLLCELIAYHEMKHIYYVSCLTHLFCHNLLYPAMQTIRLKDDSKTVFSASFFQGKFPKKDT